MAASPEEYPIAPATAFPADDEAIFLDSSEDVLFAVHEEEPLELLVEDLYEESWSDDGANIGVGDMQMEHEAGCFDKYDLFSENFDCGGGEYAAVESYGLVL